MKKTLLKAKEYYLHIHKLSFAFISSGIGLLCLFSLAALIVLYFPGLLKSPCDAKIVSLELFYCGIGFFLVDIFFGFISDIVIKYDLEEK